MENKAWNLWYMCTTCLWSKSVLREMLGFWSWDPPPKPWKPNYFYRWLMHYAYLQFPKDEKENGFMSISFSNDLMPLFKRVFWLILCEYELCITGSQLQLAPCIYQDGNYCYRIDNNFCRQWIDLSKIITFFFFNIFPHVKSNYILISHKNLRVGH